MVCIVKYLLRLSVLNESKSLSRLDIISKPFNFTPRSRPPHPENKLINLTSDSLKELVSVNFIF